MRLRTLLASLATFALLGAGGAALANAPGPTPVKVIKGGHVEKADGTTKTRVSVKTKTGKKVTKTKVTKPDGTVKKVRRVERPNGVTTRKLSIKRPVHTK